ncbi:hypothetical protein TPAR_06502, partial [Tolypocladium paradoxum]
TSQSSLSLIPNLHPPSSGARALRYEAPTRSTNRIRRSSESKTPSIGTSADMMDAYVVPFRTRGPAKLTDRLRLSFTPVEPPTMTPLEPRAEG